MCGRFTLRNPANTLVTQFRLESMPHLQPRYNVAPTQSIAIVRQVKNAPQRRLTFARWGFVPPWAKDASMGNRMINARAETVAEKPSFRTAFRRRRCLVLADGYYEWKKQGDQKQPFYIRLAEERPFAIAGLWESWAGTKEEPLDVSLETCTLITTDANALTSKIHERMPVILEPDDYDLWLDLELNARDPLIRLLKSYDADEMVSDPVSTYVNNPTHDDPKCVALQRKLF